jgi:hypothetical protein
VAVSWGERLIEARFLYDLRDTSEVEELVTLTETHIAADFPPQVEPRFTAESVPMRSRATCSAPTAGATYGMSRNLCSRLMRSSRVNPTRHLLGTTSSRAVSPSCPSVMHRHGIGAPTPARRIRTQASAFAIAWCAETAPAP